MIMWKVKYKNITKLLHSLPSENDYLSAEKIDYVCNECGTKYGAKRDALFTWHVGKCDVCKKTKGVTDIRNFGYLKRN